MAMITVDGAEMPCPSEFQWGLMDISSSESGRDDSAEMNKNRVAQKRKIALKWVMQTKDNTSKILKAFNPEYINVKYPDAMSGQDETRTFYVGDRSAPIKFWWTGNQRYESISFEIIEK